MGMTFQEAFNKNWEAFVVRQEKDGWDKKNACCVYRARGGGKCGIGRLLSEETLNYVVKRDQMMNAKELVNRYPMVAEELEGLSELERRSIQSAHDQASVDAYSRYSGLIEPIPFHVGIKANLEALAKEHGLTIPGE